MRKSFTSNLFNGSRLYVIATVITFCLIGITSSSFGQTGPNDDFDGDGIINRLDTDDDNDGIPDIVEEPLCFTSTRVELDNLTWFDDSNLAPGTYTKPGATTNKIVSNIPVGGPPSIFCNPTFGTTTNGQTMVYQNGFGQKGYFQTLNDYGGSFTFTRTFVVTPGLLTHIDVSMTVVPQSWLLPASINAKIAGNDLGTADRSNSSYGTSTWYKKQLDFTPTTSTVDLVITVTMPGSCSADEVILALNEFYQQQPPPASCFIDTDGDGIRNSLDLDSDNDGCSDAVEAGVTPKVSLTANSGISQARFTFISPTNDANNDGLFDGSSYSTYNQYALVSSINACVDTDNDGIADIVDIDDDNDGVLDTTEDCDASSSTTNQLNTSAKFTSAPTTVSGDTQIGYTYTPTGISFNPGASVGQHNGVALLGPFTSTGVTVNLSAIVRKDWGVSSYGGVNKGLFEILNSSQTVVGSLTWQDNTSNGSTDANNQTITLSGIVPSGNYYIRIKDNGSTSTSSGWGDDWAVKELTISTSKCNWDFDNDGVPNRLDLDSDGDGCSDAYESGATVSVVPNYQFTGAVGTNGLVNSLETSIDNGVLNYTSTYSKALNNSIHTCPSCVAGTVAPALSSTTKVGVCPSTTIDLTSITASNLPAGTLLTWHTGSIASGANKVANPSAVAGGTYYASFFDSANNCYSPTSGLTATAASCASGVIDCSKTQLYPSPVVGVAGQKVLYVTLNVSTVGCFSPLIVSGSGFSLGNGVTQVCTSATGVQQMSIPVYYNGSSLGTMSFTVGASGSCSADLTTTPKKAVVDMWTIECLPTQGPVLR